MKQSREFLARRRSTATRLALGAGLLMLPVAGCGDILDVEDPDIADPSGFTDATALPAITAGLEGDFARAYSGTSGDEGIILTGGLLSDEWFHSGTFPTRAEIDIRRIDPNNGTLQGTTRNLYRAVAAGENAIDNFAQLGAGTTGEAEVLNLTGFGITFFGENYCSGVPFSRLNADGTFTFGKQQTTTELFQRALDRADAAIAAATAAGTGAAATEQLNVARVLKGRVLVNLDRYAEAAAAVAEVPTSFNFSVLRSDNTGFEQNGIYVFNVIVERWSVPNQEGGNGLPYRTHRVFSPTSADSATQDPRVPWRRVPANDVGFDRTTPQYDNRKYISRSSPVPLATGIEARLIEAEAALEAGDMTLFLSNLNDARLQAARSVPTEAPLAGAVVPLLTAEEIPADMAGRVDLLFAERAYDLWITGHRLGDLRRLIRQYGRPANTVFPEGQYHKNTLGGIYGEDVNLPISIDERNNPEFSAFPAGNLCIDRGA